jgi:hypothetical protein
VQAAWKQLALLCLTRLVVGPRAFLEVDGPGFLRAFVGQTDAKAPGLFGRATSKSLGVLAGLVDPAKDDNQKKQSPTRRSGAKKKSLTTKSAQVETKTKKAPTPKELVTWFEVASKQDDAEGAVQATKQLVQTTLDNFVIGVEPEQMVRGLVAFHALASARASFRAATLCLFGASASVSSIPVAQAVPVLFACVGHMVNSASRATGVSGGYRNAQLVARDESKEELALVPKTRAELLTFARHQGLVDSKGCQEPAGPLCQVLLRAMLAV